MPGAHARRFGAAVDAASSTVIFRVYSHHATRMEVCFHAAARGPEVFRAPLQRDGDGWSRTFALHDLQGQGLAMPFYYGYRAWGPNWIFDPQWCPGSTRGFLADVDDAGNRFNPNKLLIDPYTLELSHDPAPALTCQDPNAYSDEFYGEHWRACDTGTIAPKSLVLAPEPHTSFGTKPQRPLKDDVIYEVHLRGFTARDPSIPEAERGTYKGAARKARYLKELGVTAIELLPVQEFADEQNDDGDPRGDNYWGYMTLAFFAPNRRYASDKRPGGPTREFMEMVAAFHAQGIKVFMDVVYNHTGEGFVRRDAHGHLWWKSACLLSFGGLDNASYYQLKRHESGEDSHQYETFGGCGANFNYANVAVQDFITDSLQHWSRTLGVDGFRFDLAPILGMRWSGREWVFDAGAPLLEAIMERLPARTRDPSGCDLIAEPWGGPGCAPSDLPPEWALWNCEYRDVIRSALNKYNAVETDVAIDAISRAVAGSSHTIRKRPWHSINYIASHDDENALSSVFMYNRFCHLMNRQVVDDKRTWCQGGDPERQKKAMRNAFTLLMLSAGVPMFAGGDELFRKVPGYVGDMGCMDLVALDVPEVWLDWSAYHAWQTALVANDVAAMEAALAHDGMSLFDFVRKLITFRNLHPCLRPDHYFTGQTNPATGLKDISWHCVDGSQVCGTGWNQREFLGYRIDAGTEGSIYVGFNRSPGALTVQLPPPRPRMAWHRLLDTGSTDAGLIRQRYVDGEKMRLEKSYVLHERSVVVALEM